MQNYKRKRIFFLKKIRILVFGFRGEGGGGGGGRLVAVVVWPAA
jgi:hypothetical protein